MAEVYRVLIVDDDLAQAEMLSEFLRVSGFRYIDRVPNIHTFWQKLKERSYDIILLDYKLPDGTGLDVLQQMNQSKIRVPVIMITGQGTELVAAQAIQYGAVDYILKSGDYLATLPVVIQKSIQDYQLKLSVDRTLEKIRYQALLLNNVRDAVVVWDLAGRITYWNPAATSLFGWSAEERLGRPVARVYLDDFTPPANLPKDGEVSSPHVIRKYIHRDGRTVWVSSRITALRDAERGNRLIGYMDVSHDITRRVEAEQALRESEARYRAIVEDYQTELICRFRPNGTLTFVNEVYCQYFNRSREELIGMNLLYFLPEGERPKLIQHLVSFSADKPVAILEHQVDLPQKGIRWLQRTDRAIFDKNGRIFEFQSIGQDITARKRLEAQIQAAQSQLVQSARLATIGEIASGVAHQIYNPLTTIIADAQLLNRSLEPNHPARESAEAIEQAGWRLQQVVERLLAFSRPTSQKLTSLAINDTLLSAISLVSSSLEAAGCQLTHQLDRDLPHIQGDQHQLENLWVNLLLLARDATVNGNGHSIQVRSYTESEKDVTIDVIDDGTPIPPDQLATIFEPNFVGATASRGTGMEMSITREIVRQHGGQITASSLPGLGTTIKVVLPMDFEE